MTTSTAKSRLHRRCWSLAGAAAARAGTGPRWRGRARFTSASSRSTRTTTSTRRNFTARLQLHHAADHAGEPAEDEGGRPRRVVHDRLRRPGEPAAGRRRVSAVGYDRAYKAAIAKFDAVHRLTEEIAPNEIGSRSPPPTSSRITKSGKKVAVIGIENGYPIGTDINRVKEFCTAADATCRSRTTATASSRTRTPAKPTTSGRWGGLSPLGRQVMQEMNKWGIMVDVSHPSKGVDDAGDRPVEGAGHRLAFRRARARQHQPQHGRRAC